MIYKQNLKERILDIQLGISNSITSLNNKHNQHSIFIQEAQDTMKNKPSNYGQQDLSRYIN